MILIDVSGANVIVRKQDTLTSGMVGAAVVFRFDEDWKSLAKTAVFRAGKVIKDAIIVDSVAEIPHEVLATYGYALEIGVYGTADDGSVVIPTIWGKTDPIKPGTDPSGDESLDPSLPVWAQIQEQIASVQRFSDETSAEHEARLIGIENVVGIARVIASGTVEAAEPAWSEIVVADGISLKKGKAYNINCSVKTDATSFYAYLYLKAKAAESPYDMILITQDDANYTESMTFTADDDYDNMRLYFKFNLTSGLSATASLGTVEGENLRETVERYQSENEEKIGIVTDVLTQVQAQAVDAVALFADTGMYYDKTLKENTYSYTGQATIPVSAGEVYYLSSYAHYQMVRYILADDDNLVYGYATEGDVSYYDNTKIVVPKGATKLIIQSRTSQRAYIVLKKEVVGSKPFVLDKLQGKTILFAGDSICHDSLHGSEGWAARIGKAHGMVYKNYGIDGSTITTGLLKNSIIGDTLPKMISEYPNADYIIFEGGTNDADLIGSILDGAKPAKYGEVKVGYGESNFDTATFCGAVEMLLRKAIVQWKGKKIGFIIPQKMGRSNVGFTKENFNRRAYFETIIKCCEKWGVPYINLWDTCHLNPNLTEMYNPDATADENEASGMFYRDGQHLTAAGYDYISTMIEAWINSL